MPGAPTPRPAGGMSTGPSSPDLGNMDDQALQSMMEQMQTRGGSGDSGGNNSGDGAQAGSTSALQSMMGRQGKGSGKGDVGKGSLPAGMGTGSTKGKPKQARPVGTIAEELFKYPVQDVIEGVKEIFSIKSILGINPQTDTPEEQAKKKQLHQRWGKLDQEQQAVAQKIYQEKMQKKQREEKEKEVKKQQEEQAKASAIQAPSSPKKGPIGPSGSKKQKATQQLQQSRRSLGKVQGAN